MVDSIIQVHDVKRDYVVKEGKWRKVKKQVSAVKGISFEVKEGEMRGFFYGIHCRQGLRREIRRKTFKTCDTERCRGQNVRGNT